MEYHEARSVREIHDYLRMQKYEKKSQIRDHMEFLEGLANKIADRAQGETESGDVAWKHKNDLQKVHEVYEELKQLLLTREREKLLRESKSKGLF